MTLFEQISHLRTFGATQRFHAERIVGSKETVFHHSASTALILITVLGEECSRELIKAALMHDLEEGITGDVPAPVKWSLDGALEKLEKQILEFYGICYPDLSEHDKDLLKAADFLDAVFTCLEQRLMGNQFVDSIYDNYKRYAEETGIAAVDFRIKKIWDSIQLAYAFLRTCAPNPTDGFSRFWQANATHHK